MKPTNLNPPFAGPARIKPLLLIVAFLLLTHLGHAATRIWSGGHASSANWNLRDNWDGVAVPANGDTLIFPSGAARLVNTNNIAGLRLHEIQFLGLGGGFNLRGMSLTVSSGVTVAADALNTLSVTSITLQGSQTFSVVAGGTLVVNSDLALSNGHLTLAVVGDMSLRCAISGNGGVIKNGSGLATYFGEKDNTYRGPTVVNEGTLALNQRETISVVPLTLVSRIAVPGHLTVGNGTNAAIVRLNFDDQIANTATVTVLENALLEFFGSYDVLGKLVLRGGGVTMTTGTLALDGDITTLASAVPASIGGLMLLNSASTFTVADGPAGNDLEIPARIGSSGGWGFTKSGPGTLRLLGTNIYNGATEINEGLVRVATDSPFGQTFSGTTIAAGAEVLIETSVDILREPLTIAGAGIGGNSGAIRIGSGTTIATNIVLSAPATINTLLGGNLVIEGVISGTGPLTKIGPGTLELGGKPPNSHSGDTLATAGLLLLSKTLGASVPGNLVIGTTNNSATARHTRSGNVSGGVTVNAGSLYDLDGNNESVDSLTLLGGGDVETGVGQLTLDGDVMVDVRSGSSLATSRILGRLSLGAGERRFIVEHGNTGEQGEVGDLNELVINAHVSGSANLIKSGPGDIILTASNTFTGDLTVEDGEFYFTDGHGLGATSGQTIVTGNASLCIFGTYEDDPDGTGIVVEEPLFLNTTGLARGTALFSFGSNVLSGSVFLGQNTSVDVFTNHVLRIDSAINGLAGLTKVGPGALVYSGTRSNTYLGATIVNEGKLLLARTSVTNGAIPGALIVGDGLGGPGADVVELMEPDQIHDLANVTVAGSGLLQLNLAMWGETIGSLAGDGRLDLKNAGHPLWTGYNDASTTFRGPITGAGWLDKVGNGTWTLTGTNTLAGFGAGTIVGAGTLVANGRHVGGIGVLSLGRLEGSGGAGILNIHGTFAPGSPLDEFEATNVIFHADSTFQVELNGVHNAIEHDRLYVYDDIDLGGATLDVHLNFVPSAGMEFIIIRKISAGPITGTFAGLPEGAQFLMGDIPFHISYTGGNGNDVVLTVGNLPLRVTATRLEGGNGNGRLDRDECDNLFVTIENTGGIAYNGVSATLDSLEPRIAVTHAESSFGNIPALGPATNRSAFQIRIAPTYPCGNAAEFNLIIRSFGHSPIALPVRILSGTGGAPQVLSSTDTPMAIPNVGAVQSTITSPNTFVSGHLRVRLHATHPSAGQLRFRLRAPWGDEVLLAANRGGAAANYGINCARETVFDLDAPVNIAAASAPFYGTFAPEDDLSQFVNRFSDGDWTLIAEDTVAGAQGTLQCWSLEQAPAECNPGGGVCASCIPRVEGVLSPASPTMPQRLAGAGYPGACGNPRVCPGTDVETVGPYRYATHTFTNNGPTACVTAILYVPCGAWSNGLFAAAYLGDFNSAYPCANYLGDLGLRIHDYYGEGSAFSFRVPAGERFTIVVNEGNSYTDAGQGCGSYGLELHGLPCPQAAPTLHIANDAGPDNVRLHWSTAYPGFELQSRPSLGGLVIGGGFTNVNATPVVIDGHYSVTNKHHTKGNGFFRLRKP